MPYGSLNVMSTSKRHIKCSYDCDFQGYFHFYFIYFLTLSPPNTVKPVLVATSIKQATCIKQACVQFPEKANMLQHTCIMQAPVLSKHFFIIP